MNTSTTRNFINVLQHALIGNSWDRTSTKLGVFEGKQYLIFDYYPDPHDGTILACISALSNDVACCEVDLTEYYEWLVVPNPAVWSLVNAISGRIVPDYFRYVVLDSQEGNA